VGNVERLKRDLVRKWIEANKHKIQSWIVIDDHPGYYQDSYFVARFLKIDPVTGLKNKDIERAV
jgi:hypothetical protein